MNAAWRGSPRSRLRWQRRQGNLRNERLAACRCGDTLVVTKLDRLARSLPDARREALDVYNPGLGMLPIDELATAGFDTPEKVMSRLQYDEAGWGTDPVHADTDCADDSGRGRR